MVQVLGDKEIEQAFKRMGKAAELRILRSGMNAALTPPLQAARANAPVGRVPHVTYKGRTVVPGFLQRNIKKSTRIKRNRKGVLGQVGLAPEAWYGSLIQHGWRPGKRSKSVQQASRRTSGGLSDTQLTNLGDKRNKVAGRDWFTGPVNRAAEQSFDAFREKITQRILKAWRG